MIVAIDVGIKNLAICVVDNYKIVLWKVINISYNNICTSIIEEFDEFYELIKGSVILIEKQMTRRMCIVQAYIEMYFRMKDFKEIIIYNAICKLAGTGKENTGRGKSKYYARKKAAVDLCNEWLKEHPQEECVHSLWNSTKKKDDLADTLCMTVSYIKSPIQTFLPTKTIRSRKPTIKQNASGRYSKSNIKYFLENNKTLTSEQPIISKKLEKCVLKFWKSLDICIKELGINN